MAFDTFEESVEESEPVELYEFVLGATVERYTSSEDTVTINSNTYTPLAISRNGRTEGPEERDTVMEVRMPTMNTIAQRYLANVPGPRAMVTVSRYQRQDGGTPQVIILLEGSIQSVNFTDGGKLATVAVQPLAARLSRPIPRYVYAGTCGNVLGDVNCKVDLSLSTFRLEASVSGINGNTITVPGASAFGNGFFTGGHVGADSETDFRLILDHTGNELELLLPFPFAIVNMSVAVVAGCDHSIMICKSKFDNVINFGGMAFVPTLNPFQTGLD